MGREAHERSRRRIEERARHLREQVAPDETVVAEGHHALVTDRRIIFAALLYRNGVIRDETRDALRFDEISGWALGWRHDHRPLLRLDHAPHVRIEWIARNRFLWFRWGNSSGPVTHRESTLPFNRYRDREFRAIVGRLRADRIPEGEPFIVGLTGRRQERMRGSVAYLVAGSRHTSLDTT